MTLSDENDIEDTLIYKLSIRPVNFLILIVLIDKYIFDRV